MTGEQRDLDWLRRRIVIGLAADAELHELLVFKGGNALALVHGIGLRASLDLDYSLSRDPYDPDELGRRIEFALSQSLGRFKLRVFDWKFESRPRVRNFGQSSKWGGYAAEFKVIGSEQWAAACGNLDKARRRAWGVTVGGGAYRRFRIDLSRNEVCDGALDVSLSGDAFVRVYAPAMIAVEKLRSLCQQMREYRLSAKRRARGRDFCDIHAIVTEARVNLSSPENRQLIRDVFAAKSVPLELLGLIEQDLSLHEQGWDDVRNSIPAGKSRDYGFYTDFVSRELRRLQALWVEDAP